MLSPYDDLFVHQTHQPLEIVASADPGWQEAAYFNCHDASGRLSALCGLDVFPNNQFAVAWLLVELDGEHYASYQTGPLGPWREELAVGPLRFTALEPMKRWRLELRDDANGIEGSLEFEARFPAYHFRPIRLEQAGMVVFDQSYFNQAGRYHGSLRVKQEHFTGLQGLRARRWGPNIPDRLPFYNWISLPLADRNITVWQFETPEGEILYCDGAVSHADGRVTPITRMDHQWELAPGARHPRRVAATLHLADGSTLDLESRERGTHFLGALPLHWSDGVPGQRAHAEANGLSIESCSEFSVGGEKAIGIYDTFCRQGYARYGLPSLCA